MQPRPKVATTRHAGEHALLCEAAPQKAHHCAHTGLCERTNFCTPPAYALFWCRRVILWDLARIGDEQTEEETEDGPPELLVGRLPVTRPCSDKTFLLNQSDQWTAAWVTGGCVWVALIGSLFTAATWTVWPTSRGAHSGLG